MNRSFSKIRHIQESNQRLEKRLLNEQSIEDYSNPFKPTKVKTEITISPTESDTLERIAKKYGITVADILKDNPGKTNDNLTPGETLCFQGYDVQI